MFEFLKIISLYLKEWNKTSYCRLVYDLIGRSFIVKSNVDLNYLFDFCH